MQSVAKKKFNQKDFDKLQRMVKSQGFKNRLMALAKFIMPFEKKVKLTVNMGGGSYTDGNHVVIGIHEWYWTMPWYKVVMGAKALVGHEFMHVIATDFPAFMAFQEEVYQFFKKNYGLENGRKLGAQMLNCTEDGRIEKRLVNRLKGMLKYIKFINGDAWEKSPVTGENMLMEYTLNVCYMATSGVWMKNFEDVYAGTRMEEELEKVKPLIIKAINQPTTKACGAVTMEIIKMNADFIAEMLTPQPSDQQDEQDQNGQSGQNGQKGDPTDSLDRTQAPTTTRASNNDDMELTESSHFVDEEENKKSNQPSKQKDESEEKDGEEEQEDGNGSGSSDTSEESDDNQSGDEKGQGNSDQSGEEGEDEQGNAGDSSESGEEEGDADNKKSGKDSDNANNDSQGENESQGESNESNDSSSEPNNGSGEQDNGQHPEANKSIDELIREALEDAAEELREDNEKAIEQSDRENEKIEREENRVNKEREKVALSEKEKGAILNIPNGLNQLTVHYDDEIEFEKPIAPELKNKTRTFRKEVEKIFLNKQGFNKKNRRQGRVDVNQLWRVPLGDADLFTQKGRPQDSSYAVSVLVDNSGSMSERIYDSATGSNITKSQYAKEAVITLEEGLKGMLPLQITQFDYNHHNGIDHKVIRSFEDSSDNNRTQQRVNPNYTGGGNGDGYSIKIAHRQLMKRPERQKVLFVLSDGEPSAYYGHEQAYNHVNEAVKEARADGVVVIAMRFGTPNFLMQTADAYKRMYEHSYLACEPADMRKELVKLLKNVIK